MDAILASVKIVSVDTDTPQTVRPPSTAAGGRDGGREGEEGGRDSEGGDSGEKEEKGGKGGEGGSEP